MSRLRNRNRPWRQSRYYIVRDDLWARYGVGRGFLCLSRFERGAGRLMTVDDLICCVMSVAAMKYITECHVAPRRAPAVMRPTGAELMIGYAAKTRRAPNRKISN